MPDNSTGAAALTTPAAFPETVVNAPARNWRREVSAFTLHHWLLRDLRRVRGKHFGGQRLAFWVAISSTSLIWYIPDAALYFEPLILSRYRSMRKLKNRHRVVARKMISYVRFLYLGTMSPIDLNLLPAVFSAVFRTVDYGLNGMNWCDPVRFSAPIKHTVNFWSFFITHASF